jgi:GT2 family glycosyltransferase
MALISLAVFDSVENGRTGCTRRTLKTLGKTVDFTKHRLIISDNGSCPETQELYADYSKILKLEVIFNGENIGTARAINKIWKRRKSGEHCVKVDNDIWIHQSGWLDLMEEAIGRDASIGIIGLKRKDLDEVPWNTNPWYRSVLKMLPHEKGMRWIIVEEVQHVMGTCQMYSSALLDKIGYLYQMQDMGNLYGFDDSLASIRARVINFKTVFLHGIEIDHLDNGGTAFTEWKKENAGVWMDRYVAIRDSYLRKQRSVYWEDKDDFKSLP